MQDSADQRIDAPPESPSPPRRGALAFLRGYSTGLRLPTKLLVITLLFVMLAEVLVFVPSIASFRVNWLQDRLEAARLASLAAEASGGGTVPAMVRLGTPGRMD